MNSATKASHLVTLLPPEDVEYIIYCIRSATFKASLERFIASDAKTQWIDDNIDDPKLKVIYEKIRLFLKPVDTYVEHEHEPLRNYIFAVYQG